MKDDRRSLSRGSSGQEEENVNVINAKTGVGNNSNMRRVNSGNGGGFLGKIASKKVGNELII